MSKHVLLLTGLPGVGKTTIIRKSVSGFSKRNIHGFTTEEIRENGERVGFQIETFQGSSAVLSHVNLPKSHRVGRYGVDVDALDKIVGRTLHLEEDTDAYFIDEIGKMECISSRFVNAVTAILDSKIPVVATIAARGSDFIESVKRRPDVEIRKVNQRNRDLLPERIIGWLSDFSKIK